jgi:hypothetical protein
MTYVIVENKGKRSELERRHDAPVRNSFIQLFMEIKISKIRDDWSISDDLETGD